MKKLLVVVAMFVFSLQTALADLNIGLTSKKIGPIANGFYLNIGFGFGTQTFNLSHTKMNPLYYKGSTVENMGVNFSLEIGNHFNFYKGERLGIGLDISWLQLGFSTFTPNSLANIGVLNYKPSYISNFTQIDLHLIKMGPSAQIKITNIMAADVFFLVNPTLVVGFGSSNDLVTNSLTYGWADFGFLFSPGVRFRILLASVGFEYCFGNLPWGNFGYTGSNEEGYDSKINYSMPRLTVGLKF